MNLQLLESESDAYQNLLEGNRAHCCPSGRFPRHLPTYSDIDGRLILTCITGDLAAHAQSLTNTHTIHTLQTSSGSVIWYDLLLCNFFLHKTHNVYVHHMQTLYVHCTLRIHCVQCHYRHFQGDYYSNYLLPQGIQHSNVFTPMDLVKARQFKCS